MPAHKFTLGDEDIWRIIITRGVLLADIILQNRIEQSNKKRTCKSGDLQVLKQ